MAGDRIAKNKRRRRRDEDDHPGGLPADLAELGNDGIMALMTGDDTMLSDSQRRSIDQNDRLVLTGKGLIEYRGCVMGRTGIHFPDDIGMDDWIDLGLMIRQLDDAIQWFIGDWANTGFTRAGDWGQLDDTADSEEGKYALLLEYTEYSYQTLRNIASVTGNIPMSRRRDTLSFSHHVEVAKLNADKQEHYLARAEEEGLSVRALREAIRGKPEAVGFIDKQAKIVIRVKRKAKKLEPAERQKLSTLYRELADYLDRL